MTNDERHIAVLNRMLENMDVYDSIQPTTERKKAIKAAIKALEQTTWIPVSKRLPEDGIPCICTVYNTDVYKDNIQVYDYYLIYDEDTEQWSDDNMDLCPYDVLAWIPLPKPYKFNNSERYLNYADQDTLMPAT